MQVEWRSWNWTIGTEVQAKESSSSMTEESISSTHSPNTDAGISWVSRTDDFKDKFKPKKYKYIKILSFVMTFMFVYLFISFPVTKGNIFFNNLCAALLHTQT